MTVFKFIVASSPSSHAVRIVARIVAVVLIVLLDRGAYSQQPKNYAGTGGGARTCAEFGQLYKQYPTDVETTFFHWAQGMMSGMNLVLSAHNQQTTNLALRDPPNQMEHIRVYCSQNPLAFYTQAVLDLYDAMRREQRLPDWRR
jgi:hypothetical protein